MGSFLKIVIIVQNAYVLICGIHGEYPTIANSSVMKESFNDFLASAKNADDTMPATLQQLEIAAGVKLIVSDRTGVRFFV